LFLEISYLESDKDSIRLQQNHLEFLGALFRFQAQKRVFGDTEVIVFNERENFKSFEGLNRRQNTIAQLAASGLTNSEISREMHLSISLVKLELSKIFRTLDITKRIELFD
jgi:DNA-binding NarL/FixJ family response regulator